MKKIFLLLFASMVFFFFYSCRKDTPRTSTISSHDYAISPCTNTVSSGGGNIVQINYLGQQAFVLDMGDYYLFQGDIKLNKNKLKNQLRAAGISDPLKLWGNSVVPYVISPYLPTPLKDNVLKAISHIESKCCIKFIPRTTSNINYIDIVHTYANFSYCEGIGMTGGRQEVGINSSANMGTIIHELLHALGLFHEHTRKDRDQYVNINWGNIPNDEVIQYQKYSLNYSGFDFLTFDFNSIMLYSSLWNSCTNGWTMTDKSGNPIIAQREGLSTNDTEILKYLYCSPDISSIMIQGTRKAYNQSAYTWTAVVSGGTPPYSYEWMIKFGNKDYYKVGTINKITIAMPLDNDLDIMLTVKDSRGKMAIEETTIMNAGDKK